MFKKRDDKIEKLEWSIRDSFSSVKKDFKDTFNWIETFKLKHDGHDKQFDEVAERLSLLESLMNELNEKASAFNASKHKQMSVRPKQMSVRVQSGKLLASKLKSLSYMEKSLVWMLLNSDLKLNYKDLSVNLNKSESTLRGHINNIKKKAPGLLMELVDNKGVKRFHIDKNVKSEILGKKKVVKRAKKAKK